MTEIKNNYNSDESDDEDTSINSNLYFSNDTMFKNCVDLEKLCISTSFCSADSSSKEEPTEWKPPKTYGLNNSRPILQRTYIERMKNGEPIDYFEILKDDLRNIRPLTRHQMDYVKKLNPEEIIEIIDLLNNVMKTLIQFADLPQDDFENDM